VIRNVLADLEIPVGIGLRSGHIVPGASPNLCLPLGVQVTLKVTEKKSTLAYQSQ
jgi:muramoyltetrapeptide carboxypeptidase LdcA involved in peptidoglycan recycling